MSPGGPEEATDQSRHRPSDDPRPDPRPDPNGRPSRPPELRAFGRGPDGRSTEIPSGRGVPRWLEGMLNYCSRCGASLTFGAVQGEDRDRLACGNCGFVAYVNPRMVVTTLPITERGEIVLLRRGIEPGRGAWAQPGGFLEIDETVSEAAIRETFEETGLIVEPGEIVGLYARLEAAVVVIVFESRIVGGEFQTNAEALEIAAFGPQDIPWPEIAFRTSELALRDWLRLRHPDVLARQSSELG